ncbi:PilZ domain-containing protein [Bacillus sp. FJAT-42376]|uniref:PilZ domain-containing protein n=1 Tax=Bacillus sp. FJAT-42376 TaxID=2014076 RepID=UPI000F51648A|nr:PilZ domain-containing protein [Bacillus sp. FJAT-42376]AZB41766.1 PilZ domain-containing protein [Bacillus sp. FJAT-42376]
MDYMTILTKDHRPVTAALHHIEGELMNVIVKDTAGIDLGDRLTCKFEGRTFHAYVLKQENFNLYLYLPIQEEKAPNDRRRFYRHSCQITGHLYIKDREPAAVSIIDISLNGFGFITEKSLAKETAYELRLQVRDEEDILQTHITVQNRLELPSHLFRYGSQIKSIREKDLLQLRKYLINQQLRETGAGKGAAAGGLGGRTAE